MLAKKKLWLKIIKTELSCNRVDLKSWHPTTFPLAKTTLVFVLNIWKWAKERDKQLRCFVLACTTSLYMTDLCSSDAEDWRKRVIQLRELFTSNAMKYLSDMSWGIKWWYPIYTCWIGTTFVLHNAAHLIGASQEPVLTGHSSISSVGHNGRTLSSNLIHL